MKIYDCFQFFNEETVLDLRFNILNEFVDFFRTLESYGLTDALLPFLLIFTILFIVSNIDFFSNDPPESIAQKILCINLSDISAMGAIPKTYTLNLSINSSKICSFFSLFIAISIKIKKSRTYTRDNNKKIPLHVSVGLIYCQLSMTKIIL